MTLTKFADNMRGINSKIAELQATTAALSLEEKKALLVSLEKDVAAATAKADGPKQRLDSVKAAWISKDVRTSEAYKHAVRGLQRLGLAIDAVCASGDVSQLDTKMKELKWNPVQRIALKNALGIVGAIA